MHANAQPNVASVVREFASSAAPADTEIDVILATAAERAARQNLVYAGNFSPPEAWTLASSGLAVIIDVRTKEEYKFVGHVPGTPLVSWQSGQSLTKNPNFIEELAAKASKDGLILLLCRSGKRSAAAAEAATRAGFTRVFNIREGFEGDISTQAQRGNVGGWRYHGLPWVQD